MPCKMADKSSFFCVILFSCFICAVCEFRCDADYCRKYIEDIGCPEPAQHCHINNATHSGVWLPSATICNCCEFCLHFIVEGALCTRGGPGLGTSVGRCGDGLTCTLSDDGNSYCRRMDTACHRAQDNFDSRRELGQAGILEERPQCDGKGNYAAFSCVPTQTCFCQDESGVRIFGEGLYAGSSAPQNMHCGCSRFHSKINSLIRPAVRYPIIGPRCLPDGNFNPIQCLNRNCYCVSPITGEIIEGINSKIDLDEEPLTSLECYDPRFDLYPQQSIGSPPYEHTTPCLEYIEERIQLLFDSEQEGYNVDFASSVPGCLPDGSYGRIASSNGSKTCVDHRGEQIENYEASRDNPTEYDNMDCKCALASSLMTSSSERPVCCRNGNFRRIQCRRGLCRCVDSDGRQIGLENADVTRLSMCYTPTWKHC